MNTTSIGTTSATQQPLTVKNIISEFLIFGNIPKFKNLLMHLYALHTTHQLDFSSEENAETLVSVEALMELITKLGILETERRETWNN